MEPEILVAFFVFALMFICFIALFFKLLKRLFINSIIGLVVLFLLKIVGIDIVINKFTFLVCAFFGAAGAGPLLILRLGGII